MFLLLNFNKCHALINNIIFGDFSLNFSYFIRSTLQHFSFLVIHNITLKIYITLHELFTWQCWRWNRCYRSMHSRYFCIQCTSSSWVIYCKFLILLFHFLAIFIHTIFILLTKFLYIKYFYYLHDGDDDDVDEITVVKLVVVELADDNNNDTGGLDTVDGVEVILISISIIYTYIFRNIYLYFSTITSIKFVSI